jgi:hypothetical protein
MWVAIGAVGLGFAMNAVGSAIYHVRYSPEERALIEKKHATEVAAASARQQAERKAEAAEAERKRVQEVMAQEAAKAEKARKQAEREVAMKPQWDMDACFLRYDANRPPAVERYILSSVVDPDSYQHIGTAITSRSPVAADVVVKFRSRNGFGGMKIAYAHATVRLGDDSCAVSNFFTAE